MIFFFCQRRAIPRSFATPFTGPRRTIRTETSICAKQRVMETRQKLRKSRQKLLNPVKAGYFPLFYRLDECCHNYWGKKMSKHLDIVFRVLLHSSSAARAWHTEEDLKKMLDPLGYFFISKTFYYYTVWGYYRIRHRKCQTYGGCGH